MERGVRTSEFWVTIGIIAATLIGALADVVPPDRAAVLAAISAGIYAACRTYRKTRNPSDEALRQAVLDALRRNGNNGSTQ